ncbi:Gypsy retrotransposon integrase-like protein 1 [Stygiomarasmius scandens]|uniref:Gypsy retrotransposon integrase-like protein 1 n=1 Tax=Marasmiellus scandens TaxID=2682957 RepID=A0ABR1JY38_9AGAR
MPGNRCSNCIAYNFECTYVEAAKKRGPPKAYVESLENRLEKMEKLLIRLMPDIDLNKELGLGFSRDWQSVASSSRQRQQTSYDDPLCPPPADIAAHMLRKLDQPYLPLETSDDDYANLKLVDDLKRLELDASEHRFFGKSSGAMLIQTAIDLKQEYTGREIDLKRVILGQRRPEFWQPNTWENTFVEVEHPEYVFPEDDLLHSLIDEYFINVNVFLPLLHRPTFERQVAEKLHFTNDMFATVVLLVCAVGSRYTDDRRVLLDGVDSWHSCGWKYFDQVQLVRKSLLAPPSLYDLQFYCLSVQFLQGSSAPHSCWTMVGIGIRLAQDVGAHRRKVSRPMSVEDELWKRAFWVLVCMDRMVSTALGRPCAIQDEDYDLDLPIECDDEYWEHPDPSKAFRQPPGKPSTVSAFVLTLKLNRILAFALRTIYAINKSKILLGFAGPTWEQQLVAELDSALNQWIDSVPDHLRWDPNREDDVFFNQSVNMYAQYYHLQILIHRPFIPSPRKPSPLAFPSLAICTNAARSCSHVIDIQRKRNLAAGGGRCKLLPFSHISAFTAGIVLLLNIWGGKRSGLSTDPKKEMADVNKCMQLLRSCEDRWHSSGRLWDILFELACVGDLPLPNASPPVKNKREWGADSPASQSSEGAIVADAPTEGRAIAGSRRVASSNPSSQTTKSSPSSFHNPESPSNLQLFSLPMYTDELGRLPLHGQVNFSTRSQPPTQQDQQPSTMNGSTASGFWYPHNVIPSGQGSMTLSSPNYPAQQNPVPYYDNSGYSAPYMNGGDGAATESTSPDLQQYWVAGPQQQPNVVPRANNTGFIDQDTIAMWSNAPTGFELDDWGTYLASVSELTHGVQQGAVGNRPDVHGDVR